ncbi:hypothetical protein C6499_06160 [Candidatus Poribacteria bacterium]|nr:MAG: hypothetical protein C6499_06160 [Candidatus Poribacteria bacterium]
MTETKETEQTKALADVIVEKFRNLFALESRVLEARERSRQIAAHRDTAEPSDLQQDTPTPDNQEMLMALETQLKKQVAEIETIIDELRSATPSFKTYVLPQMSEIVGTLKASDVVEQEELAQLVAALTDDGNTQSLEQLEAIIITRLRDNLEKTFGT